MVLLKGVDADGFVFFTNYDSDKARHLAIEPHAALVFWWPTLERQVRVTGSVAKIPLPESEAYFATRPFGSRLSAWASPQSSVIASRDDLERAMAEAFDRFGDEVPLPPWWGGYRLVPTVIEFWQGKPDRLHDRLRFTREGDGWNREVLAP
jgi:pyridoxamine 5'-phosphate oxidase